MSTSLLPGAGSSLIDRLPDELLLEVIRYAVKGDKSLPFYLNKRVPHEENREHRGSWLFINSTNRRIRRVGRPLFIPNRVFGMTFGTAEHLRNGGLSRICNAEDQMLALHSIRYITLFNITSVSTTCFMKLPKLLSAFTELQKCTLVFGNDAHPGAYPKVQPTLVDTPAQMKELLYAAGVPKHLELEVAVMVETAGTVETVSQRAAWLWGSHHPTLVDWIYPILKVKIDLMAKVAEKA